MENSSDEELCSAKLGAADRTLDKPTVQAVISCQFPDLQDAQFSLLEKGWDFDAYRVGDLAFRFPRRTEVVSRLVNEIRVVEHLRTNTDFNAQIPVYNRFGAGSERFPYPFAGYPFIDGQNIELPDPHSGTSVLLHNDLVAEHLLVEPKAGKLVGVIDLTDAALGDPVQDFVGLRVAFGKPFVRRALKSYGRNIDPGFWERLECRADLLRITQFVEAARRGVDRKKYEDG